MDVIANRGSGLITRRQALGLPVTAGLAAATTNSTRAQVSAASQPPAGPKSPGSARDRAFLDSKFGKLLNTRLAGRVQFDKANQPIFDPKVMKIIKDSLSQALGPDVKFTDAISVVNSSEGEDKSRSQAYFFYKPGNPLKEGAEANALRVYYNQSPRGFQVRNNFNASVTRSNDGRVEGFKIGYFNGDTVHAVDQFEFSADAKSGSKEKALSKRGATETWVRTLPAENVKDFPDLAK